MRRVVAQAVLRLYSFNKIYLQLAKVPFREERFIHFIIGLRGGKGRDP